MNIKKIAAVTSALTLAALTLLGTSAVSAQTYTTTATTSTSGTTGTTGTVGAPNTGAGGNAAMNLALLATSGAIALGGAAYLMRERKTV